MFIFKNAKITKIDQNSLGGILLQLQLSNNAKPISNIPLFCQYGTAEMPQIGDIVKLCQDSGNQTPIQRLFAIYYNNTVEPKLENAGDYACGNFLKKSFLKFIGKNIESSSDTEIIKLLPKTELSIGSGNNTLKANSSGFDMQTSNFKIGSGANFALTAGAIMQVTTNTGTFPVAIVNPGQSILKI